MTRPLSPAPEPHKAMHKPSLSSIGYHVETAAAYLCTSCVKGIIANLTITSLQFSFGQAIQNV